jgi:hypothetical protein
MGDLSRILVVRQVANLGFKVEVNLLRVDLAVGNQALKSHSVVAVVARKALAEVPPAVARRTLVVVLPVMAKRSLVVHQAMQLLHTPLVLAEELIPALEMLRVAAVAKVLAAAAMVVAVTVARLLLVIVIVVGAVVAGIAEVSPLASLRVARLQVAVAAHDARVPHKHTCASFFCLAYASTYSFVSHQIQTNLVLKLRLWWSYIHAAVRVGYVPLTK